MNKYDRISVSIRFYGEKLLQYKIVSEFIWITSVAHQQILAQGYAHNYIDILAG